MYILNNIECLLMILYSSHLLIIIHGGFTGGGGCCKLPVYNISAGALPCDLS